MENRSLKRKNYRLIWFRNYFKTVEPPFARVLLMSVTGSLCTPFVQVPARHYRRHWQAPSKSELETDIEKKTFISTQKVWRGTAWRPVFTAPHPSIYRTSTVAAGHVPRCGDPQGEVGWQGTVKAAGGSILSSQNKGAQQRADGDYLRCPKMQCSSVSVERRQRWPRKMPWCFHWSQIRLYQGPSALKLLQGSALAPPPQGTWALGESWTGRTPAPRTIARFLDTAGSQRAPHGLKPAFFNLFHIRASLNVKSTQDKKGDFKLWEQEILNYQNIYTSTVSNEL